MQESCISLRQERKGTKIALQHTPDTLPRDMFLFRLHTRPGLENKETTTTITLIPAVSQYGWQQPEHCVLLPQPEAIDQHLPEPGATLSRAWVKLH